MSHPRPAPCFGSPMLGSLYQHGPSGESASAVIWCGGMVRKAVAVPARLAELEKRRGADTVRTDPAEGLIRDYFDHARLAKYSERLPPVSSAEFHKAKRFDSAKRAYVQDPPDIRPGYWLGGVDDSPRHFYLADQFRRIAWACAVPMSALLVGLVDPPKSRQTGAWTPVAFVWIHTAEECHLVGAVMGCNVEDKP